MNSLGIIFENSSKYIFRTIRITSPSYIKKFYGQNNFNHI